MTVDQVISAPHRFSCGELAEEAWASFTNLVLSIEDNAPPNEIQQLRDHLVETGLFRADVLDQQIRLMIELHKQGIPL